MLDKTDDAAAAKMQAELAAKLAGEKGDANDQQGGESEAPEGTAKTKADPTADQEKKDSDLQRQLAETEEKRKQLARINAKQGEKAKHYQVAAVDAIAKLPPEQAKELLEADPTLQETFDERHPEFFTSSEQEEPVKEKKTAPAKELSKDVLVAEAMARIATAAIDDERAKKTEAFGIHNSLNKEQSEKLKKVAAAIVNANSSIAFEDALKSTYELEYGKAPVNPSAVINAGSGQSEKDGPLSEEEADFWQKTFGLTGEKALEAQRGANKLHQGLNISGVAPKK